MERREIALARLAAESFDLLVIGGGITGAGVALDAATRGMRVALVEAVDYASGTSSRSTKLVHGGVRYLAQRDIGLVREALPSAISCCAWRPTSCIHSPSCCPCTAASTCPVSTPRRWRRWR
jgi:hypothetical protein